MVTKLCISLCWYFCIEFRFYEAFTFINYVIIILLVEINNYAYTFYVGVDSNVLYFPSSFCTFYINFCNIAIKNIRNMQGVLTNQISDVLHFNDKHYYQDNRRNANAFRKYANWNLNDFDVTFITEWMLWQWFAFVISTFATVQLLFLWLYVNITGHEIRRLQGMWKWSSYQGK